MDLGSYSFDYYRFWRVVVYGKGSYYYDISGNGK